MLTFDEYVQAVDEMQQDVIGLDMGLRLGQCYFNVLAKYRPVLASYVRGSVLDPFYNDDRIDDFLAFVRGAWEDQ